MRRGRWLMICERRWVHRIRDGVAMQGTENGGTGYNCYHDDSENETINNGKGTRLAMSDESRGFWRRVR